MDFGSYMDDAVLIASSIVNHLTPGIDGTRAYAVPDDAKARRSRAKQVAVLAGKKMTEDDLAAFVTLAASLRVVFEHCGRHDIDAAARDVNALIAEYRSVPTLIQHDGEPWHLHFHSRHAGFAEGWGAGCAAGLALVIGSGHSARLGVCTAPPCDRVFVDTSRNGTRRFCSSRCTNRAGVAAHRARHRDD